MHGVPLGRRRARRVRRQGVRHGQVPAGREQPLPPRRHLLQGGVQGHGQQRRQAGAMSMSNKIDVNFFKVSTMYITNDVTSFTAVLHTQEGEEKRQL